MADYTNWGVRLLVLVAFGVVLGPGAASGARTGKAKSRGSHLVSRLLSVDMCRDRPSAIANMSAVMRHLTGGTISVDVDMIVSRTAQSFSKFDMTLTKCRDAVSSNSCEYYQTWTYELGVCRVMSIPGMPWSASMSKMTPPFKCPFVKGVYHTRNATADLDAVLHIPIQWEGNVWRVNIMVYNQLKELHLCWVADLDFPRVKNQQHDP
ncbi:hypothetical protein FOCC_FOCC017134 [Frankliniella occidentalis]|uniref:Uncharacterized protein LOC113203782 n=1 Tax=Frankliniella occidentalis TaxID=133901 RepID=A0A6J1S6U8_FRAOC|nr:uncharacterized protein LOC113203782 [Frankliniella occidentalis]KAE8737403.1 hypothetical protein FOCC_FOCC017134 [Frankliniella occidentalis]